MTLVPLKPNEFFNEKTDCKIPFFVTPIMAGFPSPADDFLEQRVSADELLIENPASTYFFKVQGDSMEKSGIMHNDIIVVDSAMKAFNNAVVVASIDNEFTLKRIIKKGGRYFLKAESFDDRYKTIQNTNFRVWGVCTYVIHTLKKK